MKRIIASIVAMLATVSMVACGDIEEPTQTEKVVTTTSATTTTVTTTGTTVTTTNFTSTLTTAIEVSEKVNTETTTVNEDPEPLVKSDRNIGQEEMASNPPPGEYHREEVTTTEPVVTEPVEEYLVYKPSTHYIHRNICRWAKDDAYRVDCTTELVARLCSECKPDVSDYVEYIPQANKVDYSLSDSEYTLLCQLIANEAGFGSLVERAKIVGAVMNGCKRWDKTVTEFIYSACVPYGFSPGQTYYCRGTVRASDMADAVDYYLANGELGFFDTGWWTDGADSWSGCRSDGLNYFYRA